jgi:hypothetical protein
VPNNRKTAKRGVAPSLAFSRTEWRAVTGLPRSTCDELVSIGAIRSIKIGRRRIFLLRDVERWLRDLAVTGRNPQPRARYNAHRARLAKAER